MQYLTFQANLSRNLWGLSFKNGVLVHIVRNMKLYLSNINGWSENFVTFFTESNDTVWIKSRKETPQKLTQLSSRSHPRHLVGKWTAQKDITIDTTSDSQVNSNFPNRWSPASLTFNNYFYLFLYLYIT